MKTFDSFFFNPEILSLGLTCLAANAFFVPGSSESVLAAKAMFSASLLQVHAYSWPLGGFSEP